MENQVTIFSKSDFEGLRSIENTLKDNKYFGIVYVMEYGEGVKIGYSKRPYTRMLALEHQANDYADMPTGRVAVSLPHTNFRKNEQLLHKEFECYRKQDTELFAVRLEAVAKSMEKLDLQDNSKEQEEDAKIFLNGMKNFISGKTPTIQFTTIHEDESTKAREPQETCHTSEKKIVSIGNVHGFCDSENKIWLNAEDVAVGFGFTQEKNGTLYVRWETVNGYLERFGFSQKVGKNDYLPECMVYRLGFKANNEAAENFQRRLAEEVLPTIRKHGMYATAEKIEQMLQDPENMIKVLTTLKEEREQRIAAEAKATQLQAINKEQKPKVVFADAIIGSEGSCLIGELAKILAQNGIKIGANRLFDWLRENHYLGTSGEYYNIPNQRYVEQGLFELKKNTYSVNGTMQTRTTPKVTTKGQQYFITKFLNNQKSVAL